MVIEKKYIRIKRLLKLIGLTIVLVIGYYFWEQYLLNHYLGGFDENGLLVAHSHTGFWFMMKAWPVWAYPLAVLAVVMIFWKQKRIHDLHDHIRLIEQNRITLQNEVSDLQKEVKLLNDEQYRIQQESLIQTDYKALRTAYAELKDDYNQSLEFIEKLLEKIPDK